MVLNNNVHRIVIRFREKSLAAINPKAFLAEWEQVDDDRKRPLLVYAE